MPHRSLYTAVLAVAGLALFSACNKSTPTSPVETTAPRVVATTPAAGATEVATTTTVTVTFSEPIDPTTVTILVDGVVRGPIVVNDSIVTLTLNNRLFQKLQYTAGVPASVLDLAGNRMDSAYVWTFTTGFAPLGEVWQQETSGVSVQLNDVSRGSQNFLAVGNAGTILSSPGGQTWTPSTFIPAASELNASYSSGGGYFLIAASPGTLLADGPSGWTEFRGPDSIGSLYDVQFGVGPIFMVGTGGVSGNDGIIAEYQPAGWTSVNLGPGLVPRSITSLGNRYVVVGDSGLVYTSDDGIAWTDRSFGKTWGSLNKVRLFGYNGVLVAVGSAIVTSTDGINWTERLSSPPAFLRDVTWSAFNVGTTSYTLYCVVGDDGTVLTSQDLSNWVTQTSGVSADLYGIARGLLPTRLVAVGEGGVVVTSQ